MRRHRLPVRLLLLGLLCGCATEEQVSAPSKSAPLPEPVNAPSTPSDAPVSRLVLLSTTNLQDLDGSGESSQLPFAAYLYAYPYPSPKWEEGVFELMLHPASARLKRGAPAPEPTATWRWDAEEVRAARSENLVGPFYTFMIDLNQRGISTEGVRGFQFLVRFSPKTGGAAIDSAVKTVWCD